MWLDIEGERESARKWGYGTLDANIFVECNALFFNPHFLRLFCHIDLDRTCELLVT